MYNYQILEYFDDEGGIMTDIGMRAAIAKASGIPECELHHIIQTASGVELDNLASLYGITRRSGEKPEQAIVQGCAHEYVPYTGLNESFEFCKHCDERKPSWMK